MQRKEADGIVISCDFCRVDWDGQAPMVEGHHGSVICLECLKLALDEASLGPEKYKCVLCLRYNIPESLPRWTHPHSPGTFVCHDCITQAAKAFSKDPNTAWTWEKKPSNA